MNPSEDYQHGFSDANVKNLFEDIREIKNRLTLIETNMSTLNLFKAKILGISIGASAVISTGLHWLFSGRKYP